VKKDKKEDVYCPDGDGDSLCIIKDTI